MVRLLPPFLVRYQRLGLILDSSVAFFYFLLFITSPKCGRLERKKANAWRVLILELVDDGLLPLEWFAEQALLKLEFGPFAHYSDNTFLIMFLCTSLMSRAFTFTFFFFS